MEYDGSIKIDTSLELSHLQEDIYSLENILDKILESAAGFGLRLVKSGIDSATKLVSGMITTASSLPSRFISVGQGIVSGLWNGVVSLQSWLYSKVNSFFTGIISSVKKKLGINSPSRVFRDMIGANMARGVYEGFVSQSGDVNSGIASQLESMTQRLRSAVLSANAVPAASGYITNSSTSYSNYDTQQVFNFNTPTATPSQIARAARRAALVY